MFKELISYEEQVETDGGMLSFLNVTFLKDFGPYKKGNKVDELHFDFEDMIVDEFEKGGLNEVRSFPFWLSA